MSQSNQSNHIQIPASILKEFSTVEHTQNIRGFYEKCNMIYRMNMNGEIDYVDINDCNVQIGFYTQEKEDELQRIESAFGEIKKRIKSASKTNSDNVRITKEEYQIIKSFFMLSLSRSEEYIKNIKKQILLKDFISGNLNEMIMEQVEGYDIFQNYLPNLIEIKGDANFVLPQKYWYSFDIKSVSFGVMPITPKIAIILTYDKTNEEDVFSYTRYLHSRVDDMNKIAIQQEYKDNHRAIYAKNKADLEKYVQYLKELKQ